MEATSELPQQDSGTWADRAARRRTHLFGVCGAGAGQLSVLGTHSSPPLKLWDATRADPPHVRDGYLPGAARPILNKNATANTE